MGTGANREVVPSVVEGRQRIGGAKWGRCSGPTNCGTTVVIMAEVLRFGEILPNIVDCLNQAVDSQEVKVRHRFHHQASLAILSLEHICCHCFHWS